MTAKTPDKDGRKSEDKGKAPELYLTNKDGSKTRIGDIKELTIGGHKITSLDDLKASGLDFITGDKTPKITKSTRKTTASTALLAQTIQKIPHEQKSLFEVLESDLDTREAIRESNIEEIGANLSASGYRALLAVLRICSNNGSYQRARDTLKDSPIASVKESITLTQSEFIRYTGATKTIGKSRDWIDYSGATKRDAIEGLKELARPVAQVYSIPAKSGKKGLRDAIRVVEPLVTYKTHYTDLTEEQEAKLREQTEDSDGQPYLAGKVKMIQITPSDIFYRSGFTDIPESLLDTLEGLYGKKGITQTLFKILVILTLEAHRAGGDATLRRRLDKFIANIGKYNLIESRQRKRAEREISKELNKLIEAGAITGHRFITELAGRYIEIDINSKAYDSYQKEDKSES